MCFDISNTQGTNSVASMVVFEQGVTQQEDVPSLQYSDRSGPDDFASMKKPDTSFQALAGRTGKHGCWQETR
jgi:excinuclease UvrABC nuclease subunit